MSAVLSVSPTPLKLALGAGVQLRIQVRDSDTKMPYDLTGVTGQSLWLVSLTGGAARQVAATITVESAPNGIVTAPIANADSAALAVGRWYLELRCPSVAANGGAMLVPDLFPFDVVAL